MNVVYAEEFEDVVNACGNLDIRSPAVHDLCSRDVFLLSSGGIRLPISREAIQVVIRIVSTHLVVVYATLRIASLVVEVKVRTVRVEAVGVVLACEIAPHEVESDGFAPFELLDERDTIEDLAIEIPAVHHGEGAVVEEFKVAYEREGVVATYVAKVSTR